MNRQQDYSVTKTNETVTEIQITITLAQRHVDTARDMVKNYSTAGAAKYLMAVYPGMSVKQAWHITRTLSEE